MRHRACTLIIGISVGLGLLLSPSAGQAASRQASSQIQFGVDMARRGLWNEALFRFQRALLERPGDAKILNNVAVAYEALGFFEKALEAYREALEAGPANRDLRSNYSRFLEFYQSFKPDEAVGETEEEATDG